MSTTVTLAADKTVQKLPGQELAYRTFHPRDVLYIHATNYRLESIPDFRKGSGKTLAVSFGEKGFDATNPKNSVQVLTVQNKMYGDCPFQTGKDLITAALAERQAQWDSFKKAVQTAEAKDRPMVEAELEVFEDLYCVGDDPADLKLYQPKIGECVWGITGHQRCSAIVYGGGMRRLGSKDHGIEPNSYQSEDFSIAAQIVDAEIHNERERRHIQIRENEAPEQGRTPTAPIDRLRTAKWMLLNGDKQADVRKLFNPSEGQRLCNLVEISINRPQLELFKRIVAPPMIGDKENPYAVNYRGIKPGECPTWKLRSMSQEDLDKHNADARMNFKSKGDDEFKPITRATDEQILEWLQGKFKNEQPRSLPRTEIEAVRDSLPVTMNPLAKAGLDAVLTKSEAAFQKMSKETAPVVNALVDRGDVFKFDEDTDNPGTLVEGSAYGNLVELMKTATPQQLETCVLFIKSSKAQQAAVKKALK